MTNKFNKSYKFLSLFSLSNLETYLQELVSLSFEYSSNFILTYNMSSFKNMPVIVPNRHLLSDFELINKFFYLENSYLSKDPFYTFLYNYLVYKFKIKFSQFNQIIFTRGGTGMKNYDKMLLSDLYHGLTYKDFILSSFKTRENIIDSSVNVYTSGYLTRKLVEGLRNIHIKDINCGTKYNCKLPISMEKINIPFLCLNNISICSFCLNIGCKDNVFMSINKGVVSGQALGEPSTQMLLRTFHLGAEGVKTDNILFTGRDSYYSRSYRLYPFINRLEFYRLNNIDKFSSNCISYNNYYHTKFKFYNNTIMSKDNLNKCCIILYNKLVPIWFGAENHKKDIQLTRLKNSLKINYSPIKVYTY